MSKRVSHREAANAAADDCDVEAEGGMAPTVEGPCVSGTHYVDVVRLDYDEGLKVTDPQRSTTSSLKEMELRS